MSLMSELEDLGELMATNITTKGVSASASDGLTTLAGKILQITGGGGSSITLSSNKNILSYYHSDTATLTATYQTGATMELYNADTMTKIGNFTESNGTYTYTYNSQGTGDVNLIAKVGSDMSNTVTIEDCYLYAPTEISRTSTYSSDHLIGMFNDFDFTSDSFVCELDIKFAQEATAFAIAPSGTPTPPYHHMGMGVSWYVNKDTLSLYLGRQSSGEDAYRYDKATLNTYYTMKIVYENDTVTTYIDDVKKGEYANKSYFNGETRELYWYEWISGRTYYVKNVKIKEIGSSTPYNPCSTYIAEIDSAIEYINGSGS